jgi:hypothetical protein
MIFYLLLYYLILGALCFRIILTMDVVGPRLKGVLLLLSILMCSIIIQPFVKEHFQWFNYTMFFAIFMMLLQDKKVKQHKWNKHVDLIMEAEAKELEGKSK